MGQVMKLANGSVETILNEKDKYKELEEEYEEYRIENQRHSF